MNAYYPLADTASPDDRCWLHVDDFLTETKRMSLAEVGAALVIRLSASSAASLPSIPIPRSSPMR
jgi:hypothetical protein